MTQRVTGNSNIKKSIITSGADPKYRIKIYKVWIVDAKNKGIRYTDKQGFEYHAVLAINGHNRPGFRVVRFQNQRLHLMASVLFISPNDCEIIEEINYRCEENIENYYK